MNLNGIVNKTLGLGNPLGPNMLMKECEPDFIAGGRAIALNSGDENTPVGPNLEIGYCVAYDESSKVVTYYPKTITFTIDDSEMMGGEDVRFINFDENSGVTISDDGKHATVEVVETYNNCKGGYKIGYVELYFVINPQPNACIGVQVNGENCDSIWVQEQDLTYYYVYVDLFSPKTLHTTYFITLC